MIRDLYDQLPPERGRELRRYNKARLAQLEAEGRERRERLARAGVTAEVLDAYCQMGHGCPHTRLT